MPLPVPAPPSVIVIHAAEDEVVHTHTPPVVSATLPVPPVAVNACDVGAIVYEQRSAACEMVTAWPAIVSNRLPPQPVQQGNTHGRACAGAYHSAFGLGNLLTPGGDAKQ